MRKNNVGAAIFRVAFLLIAIAILAHAIAYIIWSNFNSDNTQLLQDYRAFKNSQDSIVFELRKDLIKVRQDRLVLLDSIEVLKGAVLKQENIMNYQNYQINEIRKNIKSHPVNFADSSIQSIDRILPK